MSLPATGKFSRGEVLIGIIIALGIFVILSQAVMALAFSAYDLVSYNRARISARHIALEEIETIRNASFEDVGTIGGIPSGVFEQERKVQRNGQSYTVRTRVNFVDDPFDGVSPADLLPADYKRVRVDVSWGGLAESSFSEVTIVTDISPKGIETVAGGGTLSVLVFDASGQPVPQATVHVEASTTPPVNASYYTSDTGRVTLPGSPVCSSCYKISVTKNGYSQDRTYSTTEIENPLKPQATILEAQLTETSFTIDKFASLSLRSVGTESQNFSALPNQIIRLHGQKIIGTDGLDNPVYKFDQEVVTDGNGALSIGELEWDTYEISLPPDNPSHIAYSNPISPFSVAPTTRTNLLVSLAAVTGQSLALNFLDASSSPVASVAATLKDSQGFEASASSGVSDAANYGQVFFDSLENKLYTLIATASGFLEHQSNITVNGDTAVTILLNPQ